VLVGVTPIKSSGLSRVYAEADRLTCLNDQLDHAVAVRPVTGTVDGGATTVQTDLHIRRGLWHRLRTRQSASVESVTSGWEAMQ